MILHVDMDAFYASVEEREDPQLVGKPVIVGGTPEGRGVVCAASYAARKYGVHSAMAAATARRLCPQGIFLPCRMDFYAQVSRQIRQVFQRYTPLIEPLSLDEAFLDVTGSEPLFGPSVEIGRRIKRDIRSELRLVASVGVAPNKFLAKVASDLQKPDGFVVVQRDAIQGFLDPLPVERLWGVGRVAAAALHKLDIQTVGQLRRLPAGVLQEQFGRSGEHLWQLAHGIDDRRVVPDREAKSISHETTFAADVADKELLRAWLLELTEQVARRLRRHQLRGRTVELKVRFSDFRTISRACSLAEATNRTHEIWATAAEMLAKKLPSRHLPVRLLGVGVSGFEASGQTQKLLFDDEQRTKQERMDQAADRIAEQFGSSALARASGLRYGIRHRPQPRPGDPP